MLERTKPGNVTLINDICSLSDYPLVEESKVFYDSPICRSLQANSAPIKPRTAHLALPLTQLAPNRLLGQKRQGPYPVHFHSNLFFSKSSTLMRVY